MLHNTDCMNRMKNCFRLVSLNSPELLRLLLPGLALISFVFLSSAIPASAQQSVVTEPIKTSISMLDSTREQDGLLGPVRRVHTEMSRLSVNAGKVVEEPRMLLEVTTYDPQGKRIWNVYYPVNTGSFKGNQEFVYDEQGHVKEMALRDDAGRILSREAYTYEYDSIGNWTKMTSSLVIFEGGKIVYEPFEITSRAISYYFNDAVATIVKSPPASTDLAMTTPATNAKVNPTSPGAKTLSDVTRPTIKPPDPVSSAPTKPSAEKTVQPDGPSLETTQSDGKQIKPDVEVTATPLVQAYQIPDKPKATSTTSKPSISGGVINGKVLSLPKPVYPSMALTRGVVGKVVVEVTLDEKGHVIDARALSGDPLLKLSAVNAARQARFEPTLLSGQPVKATRLINFDFNGH